MGAINIKRIGALKRVRGVCVFWGEDEVMGQLRKDGDSKRSGIFVHKDQLMGELTRLQRGDRVEFEVSTNPLCGKTMAVRVCKVEDPPETDLKLKDSKKRKLKENPFLESNPTKPLAKRRKTDGAEHRKRIKVAVPMIKLSTQAQAKRLTAKLKELSEHHK